MKMERKVSDFSAEKWKWNCNTKTETEFCGTETKLFLAEAETGRHVPCGIGVDRELTFLANKEILFLDCCSWCNPAGTICNLVKQNSDSAHPKTV